MTHHEARWAQVWVVIWIWECLPLGLCVTCGTGLMKWKAVCWRLMRWFCVTCGIGLVKWKGCLLHTSGPWAFYDTRQSGLLLVHTGMSFFLNLCHYFTVTRYNNVIAQCSVSCFSYLCVLLCEVLSLFLESMWSLCSEVFLEALY